MSESLGTMSDSSQPRSRLLLSPKVPLPSPRIAFIGVRAPQFGFGHTTSESLAVPLAAAASSSEEETPDSMTKSKRFATRSGASLAIVRVPLPMTQFGASGPRH